MPNTTEVDAGPVNRDQQAPAGLAGLKLGARELRALRRQGFVARERRGGGWVYRLRFRVGGRQTTRYVGTDAAKAAEVQQSLAAWQAGRCLELELGRLVSQAGRELRVIVEGEAMSDEDAVLLSRDVAKKIEETLTFPGQIKVVVIRETRAVEYANK